MKKGTLIFNIIIAIAIVFLYVLHFMQKPGHVSVQDSDNGIRKVYNDSTESIVFVDLQKLLTDYKFSEQLHIDYIKRKGDLQDHLDSQVKNYEKDAMAFQEKLNRGSFLNQKSAENQQEELLKRQQELQQLQYNLEDQLMSDQQEMNSRLYDSIINYLNEFNKEFHFKFIFSKIDGSNLLVADKGLDITDTVIYVLNQRYVQTSEKE